MRAPIKQYRKLKIGKHHRAQLAGRTTLAVQIYRTLGGDRNRELASGAKLPSGANSRPRTAFPGHLRPAYERLINKQ
jgi:hypothetical protein